MSVWNKNQWIKKLDSRPWGGETCTPNACTLRFRAWTTRAGRKTGAQAAKQLGVWINLN